MKTVREQTGPIDVAVEYSYPSTVKRASHRFAIGIRVSYIYLGVMVVAILPLNAILSLRDLWFHEATLTQFGNWPAWPSLLLFPNWAIIPPLSFVRENGLPVLSLSWAEFPMLVGALLSIFLVYFFALRHLPDRISWRFLFLSTIVIGILYALIPIVTSPDVYSYIAYARMSVFHDLNPLTTLPTAIHSDPIYAYVLWVDQPSAYGPTWAIITSFMQWTLAWFGIPWIPPMLVALRLLGLAMHLVSVRLIWSITGKLQQLRGYSVPYPSRERVRATLAFAWNPLLLFEACVNAHTDTTLLVLILLMIWALVQSKLAAKKVRDALLLPSLQDTLEGHPYISAAQPHLPGVALMRNVRLAIQRSALPMQRLIARIPADLRAPIASASLLALATCLKVNIVLFFPGLLFYLWSQAPAGKRFRHAVAATISYVGVIIISYAPFWQGGAIFNVFSVNPATYRSINTLAEFFARIYNSLAAMFGYPLGELIGSPAERFMHTFTMGIFALIYLLMLWRMLRNRWRPRTMHNLIYWMAVTWLLYCAIGSPWFWPWYMVTYFGLYALLESSGDMVEPDDEREGSTWLFPWSLRLLRTPWTARLLSFSLLTYYCFITWGPAHTFIPGLPGFLWSYLSGVWIWILPLAGLALLARRKRLEGS